MFVLDIEIRKDDPCHLYSVKSKPLLPFPLMDYKQIIIFFLPANTNSPNMAIVKKIQNPQILLVKIQIRGK